MAFNAPEKEKKNYSKFVGLFNANVVAVNPTKTDLEKLLNTTIDKDPEYTGNNDENGAKKVTLSFWLKEVISARLFNVRFTLEDTVVKSSTGKTQFINTVGATSYANDATGVPSFITDNGRKVRPAKKGEELLYKFLRCWLNDLDFENPSAELILDDWKGLLNGKVDELKMAISNYTNKTVGALATVRTSNDGKEYQGVYSYEFLPTYAIDSYLSGGKCYGVMNKFIEKVNDQTYGCKDYYEISSIKEYDPAKNVIKNTNKPVLNERKPTFKSTGSFAPAVNKDADVSDDLPF
jgi:hypothetical protein